MMRRVLAAFFCARVVRANAGSVPAASEAPWRKFRLFMSCTFRAKEGPKRKGRRKDRANGGALAGPRQSGYSEGHRMIANARMYSVTPEVAARWRSPPAARLGEAYAPIGITDPAPAA